MYTLTPLQESRLAIVLKEVPGAETLVEIAPIANAHYDHAPGFRCSQIPAFTFRIDRYVDTTGYGVGRSRGDLMVDFNPNDDGTADGAYGIPWTEVEQQLRAWLVRVLDNVNAPSFWEVLTNNQLSSTGAAAASSADETPFSPTEATQLRQELHEVEKQAAKKYDLQSDELAALRRELAVLREDVDGMKRGRWRRMFYGTMAKMALERVIEAPVIQRVAKDIAEAVAHHFPSNLITPGL